MKQPPPSTDLEENASMDPPPLLRESTYTFYNKTFQTYTKRTFDKSDFSDLFFLDILSPHKADLLQLIDILKIPGNIKDIMIHKRTEELQYESFLTFKTINPETRNTIPVYFYTSKGFTILIRYSDFHINSLITLSSLNDFIFIVYKHTVSSYIDLVCLLEKEVYSIEDILFENMDHNRKKVLLRIGKIKRKIDRSFLDLKMKRSYLVSLKSRANGFNLLNEDGIDGSYLHFDGTKVNKENVSHAQSNSLDLLNEDNINNSQINGSYKQSNSFDLLNEDNIKNSSSNGLYKHSENTNKTESYKNPDRMLILAETFDKLNNVLDNINLIRENINEFLGNYLIIISTEIPDDIKESDRKSRNINTFGIILIPATIITGLWGMNVPVPGQENACLADCIWFFFIAATIIIMSFIAYHISVKARLII